MQETRIGRGSHRIQIFY